MQGGGAPMGGAQGGAPAEQQGGAVERLNPAVQQQLNLESVKTRAISLYKAISRILEEFDVIARTNAVPKWQDVLGQFSMVNLELYNIVEDVNNVSKAFVVHPKHVNAENAGILPVMLSSKLLPEMEMDDSVKKEQLLLGIQHLPVDMQIEKLKTRIDMIGAACDSAKKVIADARKAYFGTRQGPTLLPTLDKAQAAKIQEQENLLRQAVNNGEGLRIPADQRQTPSSLPAHLADILGDTGHSFADPSGSYMKNTPPLASNNNSNQATMLQASGLMGRAAASPSGAASSSHETASPLPYANSPRSGAAMMNTPSPQQQQQQQQLQHQHQQQQRQKMMQLPQQQQQQLLAAQQLRQSSMNGMGQAQQGQLHDLQSQSPQKFQQLHGQHQMQFSQSLGGSQYQGRQLASGAIQHGLGQTQLNQGNQLNRHLNQYSNVANNALFSAAQMTPSSQMIPNMPGMMQSQPLLPRSQYGMGGGGRSLASQNLSDQIYSMGATNAGNMMSLQQQQQQGAFGNMQPNNMVNMQPNNMVQNLQNTVQNQNHPNFQQQRPQN